MERFAKGLAVSIFCLGLLPSMAAANILPKNNLHLQDNMKKFSNVTEERFNEIIDQAEAIYEPIV